MSVFLYFLAGMGAGLMAYSLYSLTRHLLDRRYDKRLDAAEDALLQAVWDDDIAAQDQAKAELASLGIDVHLIVTRTTEGDDK